MVYVPKFFALKSIYNEKYIEFLKEDGDWHGFLRSDGDKVVSPYTKLQVEVSQSDQNLVHIKCCYNNKYWVATSQDNNFIQAGANDPEDDQSKLSCTLFQPTYVDNSKTIRFSHVNLGKFVILKDLPGKGSDYPCLCLESSTEQNNSGTFTVIDWSSLVILPRNVVFHVDGNQISARPANKTVRYLQIVDGVDVSDPTVGHQVYIANDGRIALKSDYYGKFWTRTSNNLILGDASESDVSSDPNTWFSLGSWSTHKIALSSEANHKYCQKISYHDVITDERIITLSPTSSSFFTSTAISFLDRAVSRSVHLEDSDFHTVDLRIAEPKLVVINTGEAINFDSATAVMKVKLIYYKSELTRQWNSAINGSLTVYKVVTLNSPIPILVDGHIVMKSTRSGDIAWTQKEVEHEDRVEIEYPVTLPPKYKAVVKAMGRYRLWDVPYSYIQTNTFADGTKFSFKMDDGIYSGTQTLFEDYKVELTPINLTI